MKEEIQVLKRLPEGHLDRNGLPELERQKTVLHERLAELAKQELLLYEYLAALVKEKTELQKQKTIMMQQQGATGAQAGSVSAELLSLAKSALYQPPSTFKMSTMQRAHRKANDILFHCYRPEFSGPPQQLPASMAYPAFGRCRDRLANHMKMPTREAQDAALKLASVLPRGFASEAARRNAVLKVLEPFLFPFSILTEQLLYEKSEYSADGVIMPTHETLITLFEFKTEEYPSYFQAQAYYSQFVNDIRNWASLHPALMVEICGPCMRISALFAAGKLNCGDIRAIVCEPLTPHQHFFMIPHDHQHMLTLARTLDAMKACITEIHHCEEDGAECKQPWDQPYLIPYPLCDETKYTDVKHVPGMQYLYTAVLHQPEGQRRGPAELGREAGKASVLSAATSSRQHSRGARGAEGLDVDRPTSGRGRGRAVLVKYTAYVEYAEAVHKALAEHGLAPELHSCTHLPGRFVEVVMDYLDPKKGWTSLEELPPASRLQAQATVTAAVLRLHAVRVTDPATGKSGPIAHGDMRLSNIMLCKQEASETWSDADVRFVDLDWAGADGAVKYPAFLNLDLGRPSGVMSGKAIKQEHDIAFLQSQITPPRQPASQHQAQAASAVLQGKPARRKPAAAKRRKEGSA